MRIVNRLINNGIFNIIYMVVYIIFFISILTAICGLDTFTAIRLISFANYQLSLCC